jgi:hypothetical protein
MEENEIGSFSSIAFIGRNAVPAVYPLFNM